MFKSGLLTRLGYMSSLQETERGKNLNSTVVLDYIRQVMVICDEAVEECTGAFNERVQQIGLLSTSKQAEIYAAMGGRQELGQRVRAHLFQVKVSLRLRALCFIDADWVDWAAVGARVDSAADGVAAATRSVRQVARGYQRDVGGVKGSDAEWVPVAD